MQAKKKLLFLTNDFTMGGVQRIVLDFANHLADLGFTVTVAVLFDRKSNEALRTELRPEIAFTAIGFTKFWDWRGWAQLYRFLRVQQFDIVFTQLFMSDFFGRTAAFLARVPLIVTEIQNLIPNLPNRYLYTDRILAHVTDVCVSTTPAVTAYAVGTIHFPQEKILHIPTNVIDEKRFAQARNRTEMRAAIGIAPDARLILCVGRLEAQKGHGDLIRALPAVLAEEPRAQVVIAGDGGLRERLAQEARSLGVEARVAFLGVRHDVPSLLRSADIFAFPSLFEGQGVALLEAMFAGLPIVASDVGGIPDVIKNEETGLLVPPHNPPALAAALVRILRDPVLEQRLARNAHARVSDQTVARSAEMLASALDKLLAAKRGS